LVSLTRSPLAEGITSIYFKATEAARAQSGSAARWEKETTMQWTTPTLVEICIGLEINGYLPAEF
jgi:coenzyme PQQ precursor peptide PqqA